MTLVWLLICPHDPLEHVLSQSNEVTHQQGERPCARSVGLISQGHFVFTSRFWRNHPRQTRPRDEERLGETPLLSHAVYGAALEAAPTLLFLPELPLEVDEFLGLKPDFIAAFDDQGGELVCSSESFIAYLAMGLPKMLRPSVLRRSAPFRDCGGYSRWEQQLDGCRGKRAALRRVECPGQGGEGTRAALRRVGFSTQEVDGCCVVVAVAFRGQRCRLCFPADAGCTTGSRCSLACQTPRTAARCRYQAATDHRMNETHLMLHTSWNAELSSEKEKFQEHKRRAPFERTPGLTQAAIRFAMPHDDPSCLCGSFSLSSRSGLCSTDEKEPIQKCAYHSRDSRLRICLPRPRRSLLIQGIEA